MKSKTLRIESDSLEEIEALWVNKHSNKWSVKEPINVKWSWRKFRFVYRLVLIEKDNKGSLFSLIFRNEMLGVIERINKGNGLKRQLQ